MVKEKDIEELKTLLEMFKRIVKKLNILNQMNWKVTVEIPYAEATTTYDIPDAKKQQIIQEAIDKRNALKQKIDSIDWTSLK